LKIRCKYERENNNGVEMRKMSRSLVKRTEVKRTWQVNIDIFFGIEALLPFIFRPSVSDILHGEALSA
jgi:hypothetical protein